MFSFPHRLTNKDNTNANMNQLLFAYFRPDSINTKVWVLTFQFEDGQHTMFLNLFFQLDRKVRSCWFSGAQYLSFT